MDFDFKIVHRPRFYHQAMDAMSFLRNVETRTPNKKADVDDNIATYFNQQQELDGTFAPKIAWPDTPAVPSSKEIINA